jgi:NitT/TauT family transport system ATP-binding protein
MNDALAFPSYRTQDVAVAARFEKLKQRPVILDVRDLTKTFTTGDGANVLALDRVSFQVHRRELLCVIGPSGCGKSTLARVVAGLESCSGGSILLDGAPVDGPGADLAWCSRATRCSRGSPSRRT